MVTLRQNGYTQVKLAERFDVTRLITSSILTRFVVTDVTGQGRRRVTSPDQDQFMRLLTLRQRFVTSISL